MTALAPPSVDLAGGPAAQSGNELLPGYTAGSLLSRGHRLDVYDAWSIARRCRCVVKVARPDRSREESVRTRLLREGALLARLDHPHWVRLYDVVDTPSAAGIVLETLTGSTLAALLDDERRLGAGDAAILGAQVASALGYLHDTGWLHLDLTPGNVVVSGGVARLIDLSLAQRPGPGSRSAGTDGYRSPEQLAGQELTAATDVWGLGLLLLEALSGDPPDERVRSDQEPRLRRRQGRHRVPSDLVDLVNACLDREPLRRPTVDDVLDALGGSDPIRGTRWPGS